MEAQEGAGEEARRYNDLYTGLQVGCPNDQIFELN